jgi:hypothetical protein
MSSAPRSKCPELEKEITMKGKTTKSFRVSVTNIGWIIPFLAVLSGASGPATATPNKPDEIAPHVPSAFQIAPHVPSAFEAEHESFKVTYPPRPKPPLEQIPRNGLGDNFRLIGHNPLLDNDLIPGLTPMGIPRGGNANLGVAAGPCVYVGSMTGSAPALVVDVSNPRKPTVIGPVPGHVPGIGHGIDQIDTVPDLNLMVIHMRPAVIAGFHRENATALQIYDISDCRRPRMVMNFPLGQEAGLNTGMHMSTIWRDPANSARVLHVNNFSATFTDSPVDPLLGLVRNVRPDNIDLRIVDLTGCPQMCNPRVVAKWGLEAEAGVPKRVLVTYPDGSASFFRNAVNHQATFSVDGTRMWLSQLGMGFFGLDSELLAKNLPCNPESPTVGESPAARASHCLKLLNPFVVESLDAAGTNIPGRADWDPPFFSGSVHTAANIPRGDGKTYVMVADEASTAAFTACPWAWLRVLYTGDQELSPVTVEGRRVPYRGDLFPRVLGTLASAANIPDRCPKESVPPGPETYGPEITRDDHGPHEPLIFPNLVIVTYYSSGVKAFSIANPLMPVEVGSFFNKPPVTVRFVRTNSLPPVRNAQGRTIEQRPNPSFGPVDMRAFSRPMTKDGLIYYVDESAGLLILEYTGPHAEEIPEKGTCATGQIHKAGFEPCPPYR